MLSCFLLMECPSNLVLEGVRETGTRGAALVSHPIVRLAFGARFLPAVPAFLILCVAIVFYGANSMISIFFSSCGQPWLSVWLWPAGAVLNIGINFLTIPQWGIVGAAVASLVTYVALCVGQYALALRYLRGQSLALTS